MMPIDAAWSVLKSFQTRLQDFGDIGVDRQTELRRKPPKRSDDLSRAGYYLGLSDYGDSRTYQLMHDDLVNQKLGEFRFRTNRPGEGKVAMSQIDEPHRGKGLYQQALLSMLANTKYGLSDLHSANRNRLSNPVHQNLQNQLRNLGYEDRMSSGPERGFEGNATEFGYRGIPTEGGNMREFDLGTMPIRSLPPTFNTLGSNLSGQTVPNVTTGGVDTSGRTFNNELQYTNNWLGMVPQQTTFSPAYAGQGNW